MKNRILVVVAAILCCGTWAIAQNTSPDTNQPSPSGQTAGAPSSSASSTGASTTTIDGCLSGSAGSYTLKDKATGTSYNLSGNTSKLSPHVGHEIQATGTAGQGSSASSSSMGSSASSTGSAGSSSSSPSSASGSSGSQSFNVTSVKMVSSSCSNP